MEKIRTAAITVFGAYWCPDCRRSKQFLGEHQISYNWVDIEQDKEGEQYVQKRTLVSASFRRLNLRTARSWSSRLTRN